MAREHLVGDALEQRLELLRRLCLNVGQAQTLVDDVAANMVDEGVPVPVVCAVLGISVATWYRRRPN